MLRKLTYCVLSLITSTSVLASSARASTATVDLSAMVQLVEIKVEPQDNQVHELYLDVDDDGRILRVIRQSKESQQIIQAADLLRGEVVVARASDKDAVLISCQSCSLINGGTLKLKTLSNGITNSYDTTSFSLYQGQQAWELAKDNAQVYNLFLTSRKILGKIIGIKDVKVNAY